MNKRAPGSSLARPFSLASNWGANRTSKGGTGDYKNELVEEDDEEVGGIDADTLFGGLDDDDLWGGRGPDTAYGGNGEDRLHGQHGADVLFGGDQDDEVHGRDGVTDNDFVSGGGGTRSMAVAVLVR